MHAGVSARATHVRLGASPLQCTPIACPMASLLAAIACGSLPLLPLLLLLCCCTVDVTQTIAHASGCSAMCGPCLVWLCLRSNLQQLCCCFSRCCMSGSASLEQGLGFAQPLYGVPAQHSRPLLRSALPQHPQATGPHGVKPVPQGQLCCRQVCLLSDHVLLFPSCGLLSAGRVEWVSKREGGGWMWLPVVNCYWWV